jgi:hypothetical protein
MPADSDRRRARVAARDLESCAGWAAPHGLHLLVDGQVDQFFAFTSSEFPAGTVDARTGDALGLALADPSSLLVTVGGLWIGMPIRTDPRWRTYEQRERTWAVLAVSRLSGWYYGLHVNGRHQERFVGGVREEPIRTEARVELSDGTTAEIVRTTIDYRVHFRGEGRVCRDLREALSALQRPVVSSDVLDDRVLAALIEAAGVLPDQCVVVNGNEWTRTPALRPARSPSQK